MEGVADFKEEYQPQSLERLKASIRTRISIWVRLAAFGGWVLSRISSKKRTYVAGSIQGRITIQERSSWLASPNN